MANEEVTRIVERERLGVSIPDSLSRHVHEFTKDSIGGSYHDWPVYRKTSLTHARRVEGPFVVATSEGPLKCEDGWLAVDARGYPYPIADDEFVMIYEPVEDRKEQLTTKTPFDLAADAGRLAALHALQDIAEDDEADAGARLAAAQAILIHTTKITGLPDFLIGSRT